MSNWLTHDVMINSFSHDVIRYYIFISVLSVFHFYSKIISIGPADKLVELLHKKVNAFKFLKASLVFIDPPFGFDLASWDKPDDVWPADQWVEVFTSLRDILKELAAVVVFGDCHSVLTPLLKGVKKFNELSVAAQLPQLLGPIQICFQKVDKPQKSGKTGYSQSIENAFVFHYGTYPKIAKRDFEINGNLLTGNRVIGAQRIKNPEGNWMNPCQKPHIWLRFFIENNTTADSLVLDLTAGSFSSYLACHYSVHSLHWAGCDIGSDTLTNWNFLQTQIENETDQMENFYAGTIAIFFFPILIFLSHKRGISAIQGSLRNECPHVSRKYVNLTF